MKVEIKINYYKIKILIDGLPHISINRKDFIGYHSWQDDSHYSIEFYTKTNKILTEQDSKEKWILILKKLDQYL